MILLVCALSFLFGLFIGAVGMAIMANNHQIEAGQRDLDNL